MHVVQSALELRSFFLSYLCDLIARPAMSTGKGSRPKTSPQFCRDEASSAQSFQAFGTSKTWVPSSYIYVLPRRDHAENDKLERARTAACVP